MIVRLLKSNYDIFLPAQRPFADEIVVSNGEWLRRFIIKKAIASISGPKINLSISKNNQRYLIDGLSVDGILACWPLNGDVWLLPIEEVSLMSTVQLSTRSSNLVKPIKRIDSLMSVDGHTELIKDSRAQQRMEASVAIDAAAEREFYDSLLKG